MSFWDMFKGQHWHMRRAMMVQTVMSGISAMHLDNAIKRRCRIKSVRFK